jgi:hypothetical protein
MARLSEKGRATFVILDHDPLYDRRKRSIGYARRTGSRRLAEARSGASWRRLGGLISTSAVSAPRRPSSPVSVRICGWRVSSRRNSLKSALPLSSLSTDTPSVGLSRAHLSALAGRRAVRRTGARDVRLEELREALTWADSVFEAALEACGRQDDEPSHAWRITLTNFYTRQLARPGPARAG